MNVNGALSLTPKEIEWLFRFNDSHLPQLAPEEQCMVVSMVHGQQSSQIGGNMERVLRPTLLWPSAGDKHLALGWIMDVEDGAPWSSGKLRELRLVNKVDERSGEWSSVVGVEQDSDEVIVAGFGLSHDENALMCTAQRFTRSGHEVSACERLSLSRCCPRCHSPATECTCGGLPGRRRRPRAAPEQQVAGGIYASAASGEWLGSADIGEWRRLSLWHVRDLAQVRTFQDYVIQRMLAVDVEQDLEEALMGSSEQPLSSRETCSLEVPDSPPHCPEKSGWSPAGSTSGQPSCPICGKEFTQTGHRNEHVKRVHHGVGHECGKCGRKFGVPSKLRRHIRAVHEDRRSFLCLVCGKKFKENSHLRAHQRTHDRDGITSPRLP